MCEVYPFEDDSFFPNIEILSLALNRVNFALLYFFIVEKVLALLPNLCPNDQGMVIPLKVCAAAISFVVCSNWAFPMLTSLAYFFTCRYYPWTISAVLIYLERSWIECFLEPIGILPASLMETEAGAPSINQDFAQTNPIDDAGNSSNLPNAIVPQLLTQAEVRAPSIKQVSISTQTDTVDEAVDSSVPPNGEPNTVENETNVYVDNDGLNEA